MQCWHVKVLLHMYFSGSELSNYKVLLDLLSRKADATAQRVMPHTLLFKELIGWGLWEVHSRVSRGQGRTSCLEKHEDLSRVEWVRTERVIVLNCLACPISHATACNIETEQCGHSKERCAMSKYKIHTRFQRSGSKRKMSPISVSFMYSMCWKDNILDKLG